MACLPFFTWDSPDTNRVIGHYPSGSIVCIANTFASYHNNGYDGLGGCSGSFTVSPASCSFNLPAPAGDLVNCGTADGSDQTTSIAKTSIDSIGGPGIYLISGAKAAFGLFTDTTGHVTLVIDPSSTVKLADLISGGMATSAGGSGTVMSPTSAALGIITGTITMAAAAAFVDTSTVTAAGDSDVTLTGVTPLVTFSEGKGIVINVNALNRWLIHRFDLKVRGEDRS